MQLALSVYIAQPPEPRKGFVYFVASLVILRLSPSRSVYSTKHTLLAYQNIGNSTEPGSPIYCASQAPENLVACRLAHIRQYLIRIAWAELTTFSSTAKVMPKKKFERRGR